MFLEAFKATNTAQNQVENANTPKEKVTIKSNLAQEFKDLWHTINQKFILIYKDIKQDSLVQSIAHIFKPTQIPKESGVLKARFMIQKAIKSSPKTYKKYAQKTYLKSLEKDFKSLALDFAKEHKIPLPFLLELLNKLKNKISPTSPKQPLNP